MANFFSSLFDKSAGKIKSTVSKLNAIRDWETKLKEMSFEDMQKRVTEMRSEIKLLIDVIPSKQRLSLKKINRRESFPENEKIVQNKIMEFLPEFYGMMNESFRRTMGFSYHDVQLQAGILLAQGQLLVEQYTGEGKTMTFMLPLALYSLAGRGAHLVTVNNYLTKVGGEYAGHVLSNLGLSVGMVLPEGSLKYISDDKILIYKGADAVKNREVQKMSIDAMAGVNLAECSKRDAYSCDVTYATNNELGFDYLRDNMIWDLNNLSQRELYFCIIDEADSILIDESRTPLIISAVPSDADTEKYSKFADAVRELEEEVDYKVDHKSRSVTLTEEGTTKVEKILEIENAWEDFRVAYHLENALRAKSLFHNNDEYVIKNGNVYIVDEFTGRVLEGRRYSEGLHQAIEAKERVEIKQESRTYATITFQNFFRLYKVLCGGSGTVMTESEEFYKIYGVDAVVIPTNRKNVRKDFPDRVYKNQVAKFNAVIAEIKEMNKIGRPVLVGTTSVEKSEIVSAMLDKEGIAHQVLNAKFHEQEARIVADAGKKFAVTVATNMAGRGTDIIIGGGSRGDSAYQEISDVGGLHVIGTERHDSRRIDNQLRGRTARQGEPGSTRFYSSMDDQIMRVLGGDIMAKFMNLTKVPDDIPIEFGIITKQIETAQKRVEGMNFDSRKRVVEYDDVMNQHREIFYSRRRNTLDTTENAKGIFVEVDRVIDTSLIENQSLKEKYAERIHLTAEESKQIIISLINNQIEEVILNHLPEGGKFSTEEIQGFLKKLDAVVPTAMLVNILDLRSSDSIVDYITSEFSKPEIDPQDFVGDAVKKIINKKIEDFGKDLPAVVKMIFLETLDKQWVDHLEIMKDVKDSISLQGYAQKDPLIEYKNAAYGMFDSFINRVNAEIAQKFFLLVRSSQAIAKQAQISTNADEIADVLTGDREFMADGSLPSIKLDSEKNKIEQARKRLAGQLKTNVDLNTGNTIAGKNIKFGRNDKVSVKYKDGRIEKEVKYKKVEADVEAGLAEVI
jgi:preprotein translocase subunit SecA